MSSPSFDNTMLPDLHERTPAPCEMDSTAGYLHPPMAGSSVTLYVPIASPPTPAPSPRLSISAHPILHPDSFSELSPPFSPVPTSFEVAHPSLHGLASLSSMGPASRRQFLISLLHECTPSELLFISTTIAPLLKRDFLRELPTELSVYILHFVDDPRTLSRASQVSRHWRSLLSDEWIWKRMCDFFNFDTDNGISFKRGREQEQESDEPLIEMERFADYPLDPALQWLIAKNRKKHPQTTSACLADALRPRELLDTTFSFRRYFKYCYKTSKHPAYLLTHIC